MKYTPQFNWDSFIFTSCPKFLGPLPPIPCFTVAVTGEPRSAAHSEEARGCRGKVQSRERGKVAGLIPPGTHSGMSREVRVPGGSVCPMPATASRLTQTLNHPSRARVGWAAVYILIPHHTQGGRLSNCHPRQSDFQLSHTLRQPKGRRQAPTALALLLNASIFELCPVCPAESNCSKMGTA